MGQLFSRSAPAACHKTPAEAVGGRVGIIGGGNASHALAALFPSRGIQTSWLASYKDEAERIKAGMAEQGHILANFASHNEPAGLVTGAPDVISKDAADVIPDCKVLVLPLPSLAYADVLKEIAPHIKPGTFIAVTPGQGGFNWLAHEALGEKAKDVTLFAVLPMPFNCRIKEFGKSVDVQTFKRRYRVAALPPDNMDRVLEISNALFGPSEPVGHFLSATLYPINAIIHPQRLYCLCEGLREGRVEHLPENPLFYESMDQASVDMMDAVNKELIAIGQALRDQGLDVQVPHIYDFLSWVYSEAKISNMVELFANNDAYKGFRCPFVKVEDDKFLPDYNNRYFQEDIPFGLCIYKGVADIAGIDTPNMDKVLAWAQAGMGKEYIVDGKLTGKDVGETTAPQRFGVTTVEQLKTF
eukprot:TRINITY_DN100389_c0_g1_i1.p1 TRINITY_DN100389_c0_g1~~TRINITY_DN100389_c0_g1_i1.p1  ORF type:complete len:414 (+),score=85.69 TRINITY_DN100389_c0_g1_i1:76-1317(+)